MPPRTVTRRVRPETSEEDERPVPEEDGDARPVGRRIARRPMPSAKETYEAPEGGGEEEDESDARAEMEARRNDIVHGGWAGARQTKTEVGDFPDNFQASDEAQLIRFVDKEPFASYPQHWIERPGKKSWTCLKKPCPLCDIGDKPQAKYCFNIAVLVGDEWIPKVWTVGNRLLETLNNYATDQKTGPLDRLYYSVRKTGKKGGNVNTTVAPVKERDLEEDWNVSPLSDDDMTEIGKSRFDKTSVPVHTKKQLRDIADEVTDGED